MECKLRNDKISDTLDKIKDDIIGHNVLFNTPYGEKRILYADFTASGKALKSVESYILNNIQPYYANVHSEAGFLAEQSEFFRKEAKGIVRRHFNADERDSIIFHGQGTTSCINKLVRLLNLKSYVELYSLLKLANTLLQKVEANSKDIENVESIYLESNICLINTLQQKFKEIYEIHNFLFANRWGTFDCLLCKMTFESETLFNNHENDSIHKENLKHVEELGKGIFNTGIKAPSEKDIIKSIRNYKLFRPIVFLSILEHNSNALTWRDTDAKIIYIDKNKETNEFDYALLKAQTLKYKDNYVKIGTFTAASNITGEQLNVDVISIIMHECNGLAFFDYASGAPYLKVDMNNVLEENFKYGGNDNLPEEYKLENITEKQKKIGYKDGIFFSPHKFLGGPNTNGVLIIKQHAVRTLLKPADTGGGVVLFVTKYSANYIKNIESREEAGTPDIIASARIGLVILNKEKIPYSKLEEREHDINRIVLSRLSKLKNIVIIGGKRKLNQLPIYSILVKFNGKFLHYNYVSALLNDLFGIQSRGGCACASTYGQVALDIGEDILKKLEHNTVSGKEIFRPGYTRINFCYVYNNDEINYILDGIEFVSLFGWMFLSHYSYKIESGSYQHLLKKEFRIWITDYLESENNVQHNFTKTEQKYDNLNFNKERRLHYLKQVLKTLYEVEAIHKKYYGKSSMNHDVLFDNSTLQEIRWFLTPDDFAVEYKNVIKFIESSKLPNPDYDDLELNMTVEGNVFLNHPIANFIDLKNGLSVNINACFGQYLKNDYYTDDEEIEINKDVKVIESIVQESNDENTNLFNVETENKISKKKNNELFPKVPKNITSLVGEAIMKFKMINDGDRILIGLSGGKDSMTLIHTLLYFQKHAPVKFEIGVITVDPQSDDYKPEPLKEYVKSLGLPYFFESDPILERAKKSMKKEKESICAFCSRMKRGIIYACARREKYNVIALGQHLDDLAESFLMSCFHNGLLRTMKANYVIDAGDLRVIRPFIFCREKIFKEFVNSVKLPIIQENCPACFSAPKERHRMKILLSQQENLYPSLFSSLQKAMIPLMKGEIEGIDKKKDDIDI